MRKQLALVDVGEVAGDQIRGLEGRSDVRVLKVLLFVTVFASILTSLSLEISVSPSLVLSTVVLYSIYYIIVK